MPAEGVTRDFVGGLAPEEIAAKTIRGLGDLGIDKVYVSNLGFRRPDERYGKLLEALK